MAKADLHDIRLVAGFELDSPGPSRRLLERDGAAELADALASDLVRAVPIADQALLVVAGGVFEPHEVLRPGLPAWTAMADLAGPIIRQQGTSGQVLAIGGHDDRLPDRRLAPPNHAPTGQFVVLPLLLIAPDELAPALEQAVEEQLFERAGISPPARALLDQHLALGSAHGQLLTLTDLMALQHVQMDAAGLGGFWPVVEHAVLAPEQDESFALPAQVTAAWQAGEQVLDVAFLSFDDFGQAPADYLMWKRAFRTLLALAESHGLRWHPELTDGIEFEPDQGLLTQAAGPWQAEDSLTEHSDPDSGLVAWTLVENGTLKHLYPLSLAAARQQQAALEKRFPDVRKPGRLCYCPRSFILQPAPAP